MNKRILVLAVIAVSAFWLFQQSSTPPQAPPATASNSLVIATTDMAAQQQTSAQSTQSAQQAETGNLALTDTPGIPVAADPLLSADFSQQVALLTAQQPADVEKIEALQQYLTLQNGLNIRSADITALNCSATVCLINLETPKPLNFELFNQQIVTAGLGHTVELQPVVANGVQQLRVKLTHGAAGQKALVITP